MAVAPTLTLTPAYPWLGQVLYGDQSEDTIYRLIDLNGDGDAADEGEHEVFFDASNASGLVEPTGNIFNIHQASNGAVFAGDGDTDSVYRLRDLNGDGDANDVDEANVWFSADNAEGLPLVTPNGIAEGADGAIYVVNAGVSSTPEDAVYRTVDLNGDGDANDAGESTLWLDLKSINESSSAFDISFIGDVAYVTDTNGGSPDTVYRIEDLNGDGDASDEGEATVFVSDADSYGAPVDIAHTAQGDSILTYTWIANESDPSRIYRLTDLDGSGSIDSADEVAEVWNWDLMPDGFTTFSGFSIAADENGDVMITSNGGDSSQDNVVRLSDLNNDGDYMDAGETVLALSNFFDESIADRPRAVAYYDDGTELPAALIYETDGPEVEFASDLSIGDKDSEMLSGATVQIVGGLGKGDVLDIDLPAGSDIEAEYNVRTGGLTLTGEASVEEYEAALKSLSFHSTAGEPEEGLRNIEITVQDEQGEAGSSSVATVLEVVNNSDQQDDDSINFISEIRDVFGVDVEVGIGWSDSDLDYRGVDFDFSVIDGDLYAHIDIGGGPVFFQASAQINDIFSYIDVDQAALLAQTAKAEIGDFFA